MTTASPNKPTPKKKKTTRKERVVSTVEAVYSALLAGMDDGVYQPGQRINIARLCQTQDLSLAPVREALQILSGEGVIEWIPNVGPRMRVLSARDLLQMWQLLEAIHSVGFDLAAQRMHEKENRLRIRKAMKNIRQLKSASLKDIYAALGDFHIVSHEISGNPFIADAYRKLHPEYWRRCLASEIRSEQSGEAAIKNYQRITDALVAQDAETAVAAWRFHARSAMELFRET